MPRRFVRQLPRPARYRRHPSSKSTGKARCPCRRGFAIIARSIPPAVALIAPTIAASSTSSTTAPGNRSAAVASALAIAIGGDFYVVIHDVIWSTMHNSTTINRFVDLGSTLCFGPQQHNLGRRRRLAAALPPLISISNSARRSAPRASRFIAFGVFFDVTLLLPDISKPLVKI